MINAKQLNAQEQIKQLELVKERCESLRKEIISFIALNNEQIFITANLDVNPRECCAPVLDVSDLDMDAFFGLNTANSRGKINKLLNLIQDEVHEIID